MNCQAPGALVPVDSGSWWVWVLRWDLGVRKKTPPFFFVCVSLIKRDKTPSGVFVFFGSSWKVAMISLKNFERCEFKAKFKIGVHSCFHVDARHEKRMFDFGRGERGLRSDKGMSWLQQPPPTAFSTPHLWSRQETLKKSL